MVQAALILILLVGAIPGADVRVFVDGDAVLFDQPPAILQGRVLVPLRGIFERLGARVDYDVAQRTVTADGRLGRIVLPLGSRMGQVGNRMVTLDVPPVVLGGRTLVPLRFVAEALGARVEWYERERVVRITSRLEQPPRPPIAPYRILRIEPDDGAVVRNPRPVVAIVCGGAREVTLVPGSVRLLVNGKDVSGEASVAGDVISWQPPAALPNGAVTVQFEASQSQGVKLSRSWSFRVDQAGAIHLVQHNGQRTLRAGEVLEVYVEADSGGNASFDIGRMRTAIPLVEIAPGRYVGRYTVQPGDAVQQAPLTARLTLPGQPPVAAAAERPVSMGEETLQALTIVSPLSNQQVADLFEVVARALPNATVDMAVKIRTGGAAPLEGDVTTRRLQADATGTIRTPVDARLPFRGGVLVITLRYQEVATGHVHEAQVIVRRE